MSGNFLLNLLGECEVNFSELTIVSDNAKGRSSQCPPLPPPSATPSSPVSSSSKTTRAAASRWESRPISSAGAAVDKKSEGGGARPLLPPRRRSSCEDLTRWNTTSSPVPCDKIALRIPKRMEFAASSA